MKYLDESLILAHRYESTPKSKYLGGYGAKIPTCLELRIKCTRGPHKARWYRVYVAQFSNLGTAYILSHGETIYIHSGLGERLKLKEQAHGIQP